jgi:hypothetical protein
LIQFSSSLGLSILYSLVLSVSPPLQDSNPPRPHAQGFFKGAPSSSAGIRSTLPTRDFDEICDSAFLPELSLWHAGVIRLLFLIGHLYAIAIGVWVGEDKQQTHKAIFKKKIELTHCVLLSIPHSIVNTIGRTYIFSLLINNHVELPIIITEDAFVDASLQIC